tara:strand:- start:37 stop:285 length:249 start_codon:yes stop_codon:yes gene_type:complete
MTKDECCLEDLEYVETPIANELELWHCNKCNSYYDLPIEINRYWDNIKLRSEDRHTDAIQRALIRLKEEIGFGVKDRRYNES